MNENGLTYEQWLAAAGIINSNIMSRMAWRKGEDPTEYRA